MTGVLPALADGLNRTSRVLDRACLAGAMGFTVLLLILVLVQVFARYVLAQPPGWTEEAGRYCMIWAGLLGASVAFRRRQDPRLLAIEQLVGRRLRLAELADALTVLVFCGVLLAVSPGFVARQALRHSDALQLNMGLVGAILPVFAAVMLVHAGALLTAAWASAAQPRREPG
ncbi:MAG: TRAP transporter small permease subunit [Gammaproteobacteria bacterium]|nr:MAG: TRAP transporter small permease subunit [Gammaproteobacteria bacterium]